MAMVNPMGPMMSGGGGNNFNVKDSRWLTLEVCREFQRSKCSRPETECKFAHPPPHVEVQNGRVTCCFDSIKGKCQRKDPPCKYLHPPQHLREQLLQNGKNNLILKNLQMQVAQAYGIPPMVPGMIPVAVEPSGKSYSYGSSPSVLPGQSYMMAHPYFNPVQTAAFSPYNMSSPLPGMTGMIPTSEPSQVSLAQSNAQVTTNQGVLGQQQNMGNQQKVARADRLENTNADLPQDSSHNCVQCISNGMPPLPGMVPYVKRPAMADAKSGLPMYQPGTGSAAAYQQAALAAMQLQQGQAFVPVSYPMIHTSTSMLSTGGQLVSNSQCVNFFDDKNQLLDTLPVCRDFKSGQCVRPQCKYVHLIEDYVEVTDGKVTVCRDAAKGKCSRPMCKYYHVPVLPHLIL